MFENEFIDSLKEINIILDSKQLDMFKIYKDELIIWNDKFNLTSIVSEEEIYLKHFYDSILLSIAYEFNTETKLLDIGTGAGFPGIALKIVFPLINLTLVESNNKKCGFLNNIISKLQLTNINVICSRAEELDKKYREYFDVITSRAVANICILSELSLPFLSVGGLFLPMKGNIENPIDFNEILLRYGAKEEKTITYNLSIINAVRSIPVIRKISKTSLIYPREYKQIVKEFKQ